MKHFQEYGIDIVINGRVAQLDRVSASEAEGRGFESRLAHQFFPYLEKFPFRSNPDTLKLRETAKNKRTADESYVRILFFAVTQNSGK